MSTREVTCAIVTYLGILIASAFVFFACDDPGACSQASDCFSGEICYQGSCTPQVPGDDSGTDSDADHGEDADTDDDGGDGQDDGGGAGDGGDPQDGGDDTDGGHSGPKVVQVAAGTLHTCALFDTGTVKCWGRCSEGQCGNGEDRSPRPTPTEVSGLSDVREIVAGHLHTCAITQDDNLYCWGTNSSEQIVPGDDTYKLSPTDVGLSDVLQVGLGDSHTCARVRNIGAECWGAYTNGATGVPDDLGEPSWISAGYNHSCAVVSGEVQCWGRDQDDQLGEGNPWVFGITDASAVEAGQYHTCALLGDRSVSCWGGDQSGTPQTVEDVSEVVELDVGQSLNCVRTSAGAVQCWGSDHYQFNSETAKTIFGLTSGVVDIGVGASHACAVKSSGELVCWGNNDGYKLGDRTQAYRDRPVTVEF